MRVYWTGALYFLEADIALRSVDDESAPAKSLDDVLRLFNNCCLQDGKQMRGRAIAAEFDRLANTELFVPLYDRYEATRAIPDYDGLLESPVAADIFIAPAN